MSNETRKAIGLKDMKVGEKIEGYIKGFFKNPKGLTPDVENLVLVEKSTGKEVTVWASGTLNYMRDRMSKAGVSEGVLTRITRIERPESTKKGSKQKYFAEILFNKKDVKPIEELERASSGSRSAKVDGDFSEF